MANTQVIKKKFTNDSGESIPYNVLEISGYVNGLYQAIEVKISRAEALAIGMILASDDSAPVVDTRRSTREEIEEFRPVRKKDERSPIGDTWDTTRNEADRSYPVRKKDESLPKNWLEDEE